MADFLDFTKHRLKSYRAELQAIESEKKRLELLKSDLFDLRAVDYRKDRVSGGRNKDDIIITTIYKIQQAEKNITYLKADTKQIARVVSELPDDERVVLIHFYLNHEKFADITAGAELCCERSQVYRVKTQAIERLTRRLYGRLDSHFEYQMPEEQEIL